MPKRLRPLTFLASSSALLALLVSASPASATAVWHERLDPAFAAARAEGKLVLVDLYADWCGWCKTMDKQVFSTPEFESYFGSTFVLARVDVEDRGEGAALQQRFRAESLPTLLLLDGNRVKVGEIQGFQPLDRLAQRVKSELGKYQMSLQAYDKALAGTDPKAWAQRASEMHQRGDGARAAKLYAKMVGERTLADRDRLWTHYFLADSYRMAGDLEQARVALAAARKAAAAANDVRLGERLSHLSFVIARDEHDCREAKGALTAFEKAHPASPLLPEVKKAYSALRSDDGAQCS